MHATCMIAISLAACGSARPAPPASVGDKTVDPARWLSEHGAVAKDFGGDNCTEIVVGPEHEPALLCTLVRFGGNQQPPGHWIDTRRIAFVVRAGAITSVLDVGVSLQGDDNGWPRLILQLEFAADGRSVALVDRNIVYASDSTKATNDVEPSEGCDSEDRDEFLRRLCMERGTFRWNGTRYVRAP